ncbi:MAG: hypothetical protein HQ534_01835 [Armatimonadetes bacterium]|nr:hypothetical protein [Armatimonadota bacterium]
MKKRNILTILVLLACSSLLFAGGVIVHVTEDYPQYETGWVSARHFPNPWGEPQAYSGPATFTFPPGTLPVYYLYNTDAGIVDTENYTVTGTAPSQSPYSHIYLHIDKSEIPDPGEPGND